MEHIIKKGCTKSFGVWSPLFVSVSLNDYLLPRLDLGEEVLFKEPFKFVVDKKFKCTKLYNTTE